MLPSKGTQPNHERETIQTDQVYERAAEAIAAMRSQDDERIDRAITAFNSEPPREQISDLCVRVEDLTLGKDVDHLLGLTVLPLPAEPKRLIRVVELDSLIGLRAYASADHLVLVTSMLMLIASLHESGERNGIPMATPELALRKMRAGLLPWFIRMMWDAAVMERRTQGPGVTG